jgi:putative DNA methylase
MFAGGGAIPLEALRLGCDAYALDLNPVAHIIELCTLVYPQKYGKPDSNARGMTGPKNAKGEPTWGGLADEVRYWGNSVLQKVKAEIGDLYPLIPDPEYKGKRPQVNEDMWKRVVPDEMPPGYLMPVAYLWTRTVTCKNPKCGAAVPLLKQTWLCRKEGKKTSRFVALRIIAPKGKKRVRFEIVTSPTEKDLGFDPTAGSKGGNATCPFCGTVADSDYVKQEGCAGRMGQQLMAIACTRPGRTGKVYLSADDVSGCEPDEQAIRQRTDDLCKLTGLTVPDEPIEARMTGGICLPYGLTDFGRLFSPRQMLCLLSFAAAVREAGTAMHGSGRCDDAPPVVLPYLGIVVDRQADYNSSLARWHNTRELITGTFGRQALPMVWDFAELAPFGGASGSPVGALNWIVGVVEEQAATGLPAVVSRGSATSLSWPDASLDAVVTDPPYYDNVDYAKLSDFFYVWLKRTIGHLYPEHFASAGTPKKAEAVADPVRHGGSKAKARKGYEGMMAESLREANRVLKPAGVIVTVYAHKTTFGWATLVDALRQAGFAVIEAWPLDTEMKARLVAMETSALASSILLVARKRAAGKKVGGHAAVREELETIVRRRVKDLWDAGISGADLRIACIGAGMKAFTQFGRVEMENGEEVTSERFLHEVEALVQETLLERLLGAKSSLAGMDAVSQFYVLWRFDYQSADVDSGEAIVFSYPHSGVELDGVVGLSSGKAALLQKTGKKYKARDYAERGDEPSLGVAGRFGLAEAPLIDVLHRLLWLMENRTPEIPTFLDQAHPNVEQLRLLAEVLAGETLKGSGLKITTDAEQSAVHKLTGNWAALVDENLFHKK